MEIHLYRKVSQIGEVFVLDGLNKLSKRTTAGVDYLHTRSPNSDLASGNFHLW